MPTNTTVRTTGAPPPKTLYLYAVVSRLPSPARILPRATRSASSAVLSIFLSSPVSTAPFPALDSPYLSLHVSPTPDSPLNSSMDYKPSFSDIPAIFHRGAGKRGGVRITPDALQSLSLFASAPAALRSSLAAHGPITALRPPAGTADRSHLLHVAGCRPPDETPDRRDAAEFRGESDRPHGKTPIPAVRRCTRWSGSRGLLEVLLAMSQKHDLSGLTAVMVCNHVELNPHAEADAQLCYDFLNTGECKRPAGMCRFRHVCSDHIEAVVDRIRSGKVVLPRGFDVDAGVFDLSGGRFVSGDVYEDEKGSKT